MIPPKIYCIYHHVDFDGICSAKIVEEAYPKGSVEFIPYNYGETLPTQKLLDSIKIHHPAIIVMVDVCLPVEDVKQLINEVGSENFIWIDHHITAIEKMRAAGLDDIKGARLVGEAACVLTYKYFNKVNGVTPLIPMGVQLIGCLDIWDQSGIYFDWNTEINPFYTGLEGKFNDVSNFPSIRTLGNLHFVEETIGRGKTIQTYLDNRRKNNKPKAFEVTIDGLVILALNSAARGSATLYPIFDPLTQDGVMMFSYDGTNKIWTYSLYTTKKDIDVSQIASKRGGGGHKSAVGFSSENLLPELKEIMIK